MKGTKWNGDYFATKGCTRSDGSYMFSVGDMVAFEVTTYSSPDGRSYSYGCIPSHQQYKLQEEILLEEFDKTESDRYGSGSYDIKKITELKDVFWHQMENPRELKTFLLAVLDASENVFLNIFIPGDIAKVRNHPGKFLHIYEIPRGYRKCKMESFTETVEAINLQKMQEGEGAETISRATAGEAVDAEILKEAHISASQWVCTPWEYFSLVRRTGLEIAIAVAISNGHREIADDIQSWKDAGISDPDLGTIYDKKDSCYNHSYYIKRNGWEKGIAIAGESYGLECVRRLGLYYLHPDSIKQHIAAEVAEEGARKKARKAKFEELSKAVTEKHGEEVLRLALKKKGCVLKVLSALINSQTDITQKTMSKIIEIGETDEIIANLIAIISSNDVFPTQAGKIAEKAYAWAYLYDSCPGVKFSGYFGSAQKALKLYSENWEYKNSSASFTLGDIDTLQGLKEKLA